MRLCLYDLTNFYFEGRKEGSTLAQFGRSMVIERSRNKEKRSDAKLISLDLLTNGQAQKGMDSLLTLNFQLFNNSLYERG